MAVEICILSGVRQGEQFVLDAKEFKAGPHPNHEVFFDARHDKGISGRSAWFRLQEDGWSVRAAGGEILLNQDAVDGWTRIRSGDVVRMSEAGPDFSFRIVAAAAAAPAKQSPDVGIVSIALTESNVPRDVDAAPAVAPARPRQVMVADGGGETPGLPSVTLAEPQFSSSPRPVTAATLPAMTNRRHVMWIVAGVGVAILCLIALKSLSTPPTVVVTINSPNSPEPTGDPRASSTDAKPTAARETTAKADFESKSSANRRASNDKTVPNERSVADFDAELGEAVYLVQVEKSGHCWPYATCTAIDQDTLLTSAREAMQLAAWQSSGDFKVWVTRQADGFKEEVRDVHVNAVFESLAQKPNDWIYFDVGLLTVPNKLPKAAPLASAEDLADIEEGMPVVCFGYTHEGEKTTRFDHFEARPSHGKIYVITASETLPGRPRLLHLRAEIPKFAYGSPVVNERGRILGVYGETAVSPSGENAAGQSEIKNMHYVALVNPEMVERWLHDHDVSAWPPAASPSSVQTMQDNP